MMKAEELRIGNYVNVPRADQSPFRIDAFEYLGKDFGKVAQNNGTYMVMDIEVPYHPLTWELKDLSPIPLSPTILEKCGFEKIVIKHMEFRKAFVKVHNHTHYVFYLGKPEYKLTNPNKGILNIHHPFEKDVPAPCNEDVNRVMDWPESTTSFAWHIAYLHQLQNLYYCLTGTELTITL